MVIVPKDVQLKSELIEDIVIIRETTFPEGGKIAKKLNTYDIDLDEIKLFNNKFKNEGVNPRNPNKSNMILEDFKSNDKLLDAKLKDNKKSTSTPKSTCMILFDKDITFFHSNFINGIKTDDLDVKSGNLVTFMGDEVKGDVKIIAVIHQYGRLNDTQESKMKLLAENFGI